VQAQRVVFNLLIRDQAGIRLRGGLRQFRTAVTWSAFDGYQAWNAHEGKALVRYLGRFNQLIGFGALHYDLHVLGSYVSRDHYPVIDGLRRHLVDLEVLLRQHSGLRLTLNQVARDTLQQSAFALPDAFASDEECFRYNERNVALIRKIDDFRRVHGFLSVGNFAVRLPHDRDIHDEAA
jgi:hypothetical protein